jgi:hypothetical protein
MNRAASNCGDSNHMTVSRPNVEFLRAAISYKGVPVGLHTAGTVAFHRRFWSQVPRWNERAALCI